MLTRLLLRDGLNLKNNFSNNNLAKVRWEKDIIEWKSSRKNLYSKISHKTPTYT